MLSRTRYTYDLTDRGQRIRKQWLYFHRYAIRMDVNIPPLKVFVAVPAGGHTGRARSPLGWKDLVEKDLTRFDVSKGYQTAIRRNDQCSMQKKLDFLAANSLFESQKVTSCMVLAGIIISKINCTYVCRYVRKDEYMSFPPLSAMSFYFFICKQALI